MSVHHYYYCKTVIRLRLSQFDNASGRRESLFVKMSYAFVKNTFVFSQKVVVQLIAFDFRLQLTNTVINTNIADVGTLVFPGLLRFLCCFYYNHQMKCFPYIHLLKLFN